MYIYPPSSQPSPLREKEQALVQISTRLLCNIDSSCSSLDKPCPVNAIVILCRFVWFSRLNEVRCRASVQCNE